ncbi:MAG: hypothetical protein U0989_18510 [Azonexus sp.]|nr:hypothetical protein [Erythrobacter sp.]MDZ4316747.1 hypothetical protein [Azonexus sp.]
MNWGDLTLAAIAVGAISLFLRWRFPAVPPVIASAGLGASICVAICSRFQMPPSLIASLTLNAALLVAGIDFIFRRNLEKEPSTPASGQSDFETTNRRRSLIVNGRKLIAEFHRQSDHEKFVSFLATQDVWQEIRPYFDQEKCRELENPNMFVVTNGEIRDGKIYYFRSELDRLEKEWGLKD